MIYIRQEILEGIRRHVQSLEGLKHVQILGITPGRTKIAWNIHLSALNLYGNLHGGLIFVLCNMTVGMATYAYEVFSVTQQGYIHSIKSVSSGKLYVQAGAVHKRSRTVIHHVGVTTPEEKVVVDATFTMSLFGSV